MYGVLCTWVRTGLCLCVSVDFSRPVSSAPQSYSCRFVAEASGRAQVVLSWWDLDMDPGGSIVCSMAPSWTYSDLREYPVRQTQHIAYLQQSLMTFQDYYNNVFRDLSIVLCFVFSGGIIGCRACTSCLLRGMCVMEKSSV